MSDLSANVAGGQYAIEIIKFVEDQPTRFWEVIRDHALTKAPLPMVAPRDPPMTELEACNFENCELPAYSKYYGETVGTTPRSYLDMLDEGDPFVRKLRRYRRSDRYKRRQEERE